MELTVGDLVWVKHVSAQPITRALKSDWKLGVVVDDRDYQAGLYKVHILEHDIILKCFINDIRILDSKATIYESKKELI